MDGTECPRTLQTSRALWEITLDLERGYSALTGGKRVSALTSG